MIAAFWSNVSKTVGISTNLACIACFYALRFNRRVILFENHLPEHGGLEQFLVPEHKQRLSVVREEPYYYNYQGIEQLMKILRAGYEPDVMVDAMERIAITLLGGRLHYLPLSDEMTSEVYEYELNIVIEHLLQELSKHGDMVLVDTQATGNMTTKVILDQADLVVVNLRQDPDQMEDFLSHYSGMREKAVFLLAHYQEESIYNCVNLSRIYGIPKERIWTISEYPLLPFLGEQGRIPDFMMKNLWTTTGEKNYSLIRGIRHAADGLHACMKEGLSA